MESKSIFKSKTFYAGLLILAGAIGKAIVSEEVNMEVVQMFGEGLAVLGIRFAIN